MQSSASALATEPASTTALRAADAATHQRTRVVFVLPTYLPESYGGAEQQTRKLAMALARLGVEVTLLAPRLQPATAKHEQDGPITVHRLRVRHAPNLAGRHMASYLAWNVQVMAWLLRHRSRFDVIHIVHGRLHALPAALAGGVLKKPTLVKIGRGGEGEFDLDLVQRKRLFGPWYVKQLVRHVTAYVANSRTIVADLHRWQIGGERIHEIPNGVEIPALPASMQQSREARLIYLGRLDPEKSVDFLLKGFARIPQEAGATLTIVGDGTCREALDRLVGELGLQDRVRFTGAVTNTARELDAANIYVSCSTSEGMSNALLEAMSSGLMPLVSLVSGVADIVENDRTGLLFTAGDLDAFVARLQAAIGMSAEQRRELGRNARAAVEKRFGIAHVAERHVQLYEELLRTART